MNNDSTEIGTHLQSTLSAAIAVRNTTIVRTAASTAYEWRYILPPYFAIFFLSILGNCMVIATIASNKRMRNVTNIYLLNLAISDFLLGVFCLPFTLIGQIYRRFLFGAALCKLIPFVQALSVSVDVWTLVALSLERYFAICKPLKSRKWQTKCHAYKMIATVWVISIMMNSPILLASTLQRMREGAYKCRELWPSLELERVFNLSLDGALLVIPFFVMCFAYCLIVSKLWRGMQHEIQHINHHQQQLLQHNLTDTDLVKPETEPRVEPARSPQNRCLQNELDFRHVVVVRSTHIDKSIRAKRKVITMLFVIILEFFICWTPLHVINTIYLFYPDELYQYIGPKGIICLQMLAYCSSCSNPITYCFMNRKFRQAFITLLKSCKICRKCCPENEECKQVTPLPSSQEVIACVVRGSHTTGRSGHRDRRGRPLSHFMDASEAGENDAINTTSV